MLAVAESSLNKINDILLVVRDKAEQAASDTLGDEERAAINDQIQALLNEIDTIVNETEWNGQKLIAGDQTFNLQTGFQATASTQVGMLDGHKAEDLRVALGQAIDRAVEELDALPTALVSDVAVGTVATGATELDSGTYTIEVAWDASTTTYSITIENSNDDVAYQTSIAAQTAPTEVDTGVGIKVILPTTLSGTSDTFQVAYTKQGTNSVASHDEATEYMVRIDDAIGKVSATIKSIGAVVSRLTFKEENLTVAKTNTEAAYNRIMNADIAAEQLEAMKYQILQQTATAMLAQANVAPQAVLGLFR